MQRVPRFYPTIYSFLSTIIIFLIAGCSTPPTTHSTVDVSGLADGMLRRLAIADQVAWVKYQSGAPILDVAREQQVIDQAVSNATSAGVDSDLAARFFAAQILASRTRQHELISGWRRGGLLPTWGPLSLKDDIRPVLDQISGELIFALKKFPDSAAGRDTLAKSLREAGYSQSVVRAATRF